MNSTRVLIGAALLLCSGCTSRYLVNSYFVPQTDKVVRTQVALAGNIGGADGVDVVNYYMQVCTLNEGQATDCKTTMVLDSVLAINFHQVGM